MGQKETERVINNFVDFNSAALYGRKITFQLEIVGFS